MIRPHLQATILFLLATASAHAQWRNESFRLQKGWNAIYLLVDASEVPIEDVLASNAAIEVDQVWRWQPAVLGQGLLTGEEATATNVDEWLEWPADSFRFRPNFAYLVHVTNTPAQAFTIKGKAAAPRLRWQTSGLNLLGFPTHSTSPANFDSYFEGTGLFKTTTEIFQYPGPDPEDALVGSRVLNAGQRDVVRGKAYWIDTEEFSRYYGPISVSTNFGGTGLNFGTHSGTERILLSNHSEEAVTVTLEPSLSETPLLGTDTTLTAAHVPLQRLVFNPATQSNEEVPFSATINLSVGPGDTEAVTLFVDRVALGGNPGQKSASLVRVSTPLQEVFLPVSAVKTSFSGLWIGEAAIDEVVNRVLVFKRGEDGSTLFEPDVDGVPRPVIDDERQAIIDAAPQKTSRAYPLRLMMHVDGAGGVTFLSHLFHGNGAATGDLILTTEEARLDPDLLPDARRLVVTHLPLDTAVGIGSTFGPGAGVAPFAVVTPADDPTNPFKHTYHPDHDNLDARFEQSLAAGKESFDITRSISISFDATAPEGSPTGWGSDILTGSYEETINGTHKNDLITRGVFALRKVSDIDTLITD